MARLGRKPSENPKNIMLRIRIDKETLARLDYCCEKENVNRSEFLRNGIDEKYAELNK